MYGHATDAASRISSWLIGSILRGRGRPATLGARVQLPRLALDSGPHGAMIADRRAADRLGDGHKTGPSHDDVDPDETNPDGLKTTRPICPPRSNADLGVGVAQAGRKSGELRLRGRRVDVTEKQDRLIARDRAGDGRANPGQGGVASGRVEPDWQSQRSAGDGGGQRVDGQESDPSERPVDDSLEPGRSMLERDVRQRVDAEQAEPEYIVAPK